MLVICPLITALGEFKTSKISQAGVNSFFLPYWSNVIMLVLFGTLCFFTEIRLPDSWLFWLIATVLSALSTILA